MRLTTSAAAFFFSALLPACATVQEAPDGVEPPTMVVGTLEVPHMDATLMSQMSLIIHVQVTNQDDEPLVVERLEIASVGPGPYHVYRTEQSYHRELAAGGTDVLDIVAGAQAMTRDDRIGGQEGMVQIRVVGFFRSSAGSFRKVTIQHVGTTYSMQP
jgi:hypothetical protein